MMPRLPVNMMAAGCLLLVLVTAGCGGNKKTADDLCDRPQEYQSARSAPLLQIPEELNDPDRSGRLIIPDEDSAGKYPDGRPCLQQPPDYFGR